MDADPLEVADSPDLPPLWQVFGAHRRPDGHWALPELAVEVASPDAALHIGPQFVILETAAVDAAPGLAGTDRLQGVSSHVMFLARGKVGPFRVETEPMRRRGAVAVRMVMHDEGNGRPDHLRGVVSVPLALGADLARATLRHGSQSPAQAGRQRRRRGRPSDRVRRVRRPAGPRRVLAARHPGRPPADSVEARVYAEQSTSG